jgi:hypothetical protein
MPNLVKTAPSKTRTRAFLTTVAVGLSLGLFGSFEPGNAAPVQTPVRLTNPDLELLDVGYRGAQRHRPLYLDQYSVRDNNYRIYRGVPYGGSDEIRELQRLHPETLWPPSMRYFPYR